MPEKTRIMELRAADLKKAIAGLETERRNRIVIERDVIPIIFVPGIMGSRLKNGEGKIVWDPDGLWFMFMNFGRRKADAALKRSMLIGEKFDPNTLSAAGKGASKQEKKHDKRLADKNDRTRKERGWGGLYWGSYGDILKALQNRQWDPTVSLFFEFPVHGFGYNWTASNDTAGAKLIAEINRIIKAYTDKGRNCEKVILVTHSMGGLVARSACMLHGAKDKVLGIVHGVQPSNGSPAAYWRMKGGFERPHTIPEADIMQWFKNPVKSFKHQKDKLLHGDGVTIPFTDINANLGTVSAWVLGTDGEEVTALLGNMPGGLELLPNKQYRNNQGWERWLEIIDSKGERKALPEKNPYKEIYNEQKAFYRLINPAWLNPGKTSDPDEDELSDWDSFEKIYLNQAETFHDNLANKDLHPETYQFYASGIASADRVVFTSVDDTLMQTVTRKVEMLKDRTPDMLKSQAASLVFSALTGAVSAPGIAFSLGGKLISNIVVKDSDWYQGRGGYRDRVNRKGIPSKKGELQLVTMQLPDGAGDGTVPESSAMALALADDKKRTFCIADKQAFEARFVETHKRLKPKYTPDFDEGYFDRGHEPIYKTRSARFITFTSIENICRKEIKRLLEGAQ